MEDFLDLANKLFIAIFTFECLLKLYGLGFYQYFKDRWNDFDCTIVVLSLIGLLPYFEGGSVTVFRVLR